MILHILSHRTCDFGTILAIYLFALYILVILHRVYLNYTCDFIYFVTSYLRFWNHTCDLPICSLHTCDFTSRVPKLYLRFYIFCHIILAILEPYLRFYYLLFTYLRFYMFDKPYLRFYMFDTTMLAI